MANPNPNTSNLVPFKKGQSGNPGGKPVNARNRVTKAFLEALADDFEDGGKDAILAARTSDPMGYVRAVASLLPKEFVIERPLEGLSDDELAGVIAELREHRQRLATGGNGTADQAVTQPAEGLPPVH